MCVCVRARPYPLCAYMGQLEVDHARALPLDTHMNDVIHILLCFNVILLFINMYLNIIQPFRVLEVPWIEKIETYVNPFFIIYVVKG